MKHSRQCLSTFANTANFVKNSPLRVIFSTLFSVFEIVVKQGLSCLSVLLEQLSKPVLFRTN